MSKLQPIIVLIVKTEQLRNFKFLPLNQRENSQRYPKERIKQKIKSVNNGYSSEVETFEWRIINLDIQCGQLGDKFDNSFNIIPAGYGHHSILKRN